MNYIDLDIISYDNLLSYKRNPRVLKQIEHAFFHHGIIGISQVPDFENKSRNYINAARAFSSLAETVKKKYLPDRDAGKTEGYELGAEWFKDDQGHWKIDDKKSSFYAFVPDKVQNQWPSEVDLKTPYLDLGELIFKTGKMLLKAIGLDETIGLRQDELVGYGRMLHYHQDKEFIRENHNWCGAHFDHGLFTGLMPAYYFLDGKEIEEPTDAGLYILPSHSAEFSKIDVPDKSILLFQVGEFAQLMTHDRMKATKHLVKKSVQNIDRFAFALFYNPSDTTVVKSNSQLIDDPRYKNNKFSDGSISYSKWAEASYEQYRAK